MASGISAVAIGLLAMTGASRAQGLNCADVNTLVATKDLRSLATSSFKQLTPRTKKAAAKSLLSGYAHCQVTIVGPGGAGTGISYDCQVPASLKEHKDVDALVTAFSALLRPCLAGWKVDEMGPLDGVFSYGFTDGRQTLAVWASSDDDDMKGPVEVDNLNADAAGLPQIAGLWGAPPPSPCVA
jgi:hypothetical protein